MKGKVVASRGIHRLVHQVRDAKSWPNMSDLTLERLDTDATGEARWTYVYSWCLSTRTGNEIASGMMPDCTTAALKMLLDEGPIESKS